MMMMMMMIHIYIVVPFQVRWELVSRMSNLLENHLVLES